MSVDQKFSGVLDETFVHLNVVTKQMCDVLAHLQDGHQLPVAELLEGGLDIRVCGRNALFKVDLSVGFFYHSIKVLTGKRKRLGVHDRAVDHSHREADS